MTDRYECISITYYDGKAQFIDHAIIMTLEDGTKQEQFEKLDYSTGRRKMHELMKHGGKYQLTINQFSRDICEKRVTTYEAHY